MFEKSDIYIEHRLYYIITISTLCEKLSNVYSENLYIFQYAFMITLPLVVWFGHRTSLRIVAVHVVYPHACLYALNVLRKEITIVMTLICFSVKRGEHVTAVIHL